MTYMYRNELKYIINMRQKSIIASKLNRVCKRDVFSDAYGGYRIDSLYFDDYSKSALFDKLSGVHDRKKFRIRAYNGSSDVIKLERKIKRQNVCLKESVLLSEREYYAILNRDVGFLRYKNNPVAMDFYLNYQNKRLRPKVVVDYRREAFIYPYGKVRITFDSALKAGVGFYDIFSDGNLISALPANLLILEVKYTGYFPDLIRNLIQINTLQWQASSKFAKCCIVAV